MGKQSMTTSSPCLRSSWEELPVAEKMALVPANGPFQLTRPPHLAHHRHPSRRCYCEVGRPDGGWGCRSRHLGKGLQDRRVTGIVVLSRLAQRLKLFRSDPTC
ncbi:hypothetical protein GW17_00025914 [Ensete ventricosum]|nr:hypothetical protein GW17_00025914 [Ensete ventricosum]